MRKLCNNKCGFSRFDKVQITAGSNIPDMVGREKRRTRRRRRRKTQTIAEHYAFHANAIILINEIMAIKNN